MMAAKEGNISLVEKVKLKDCSMGLTTIKMFFSLSVSGNPLYLSSSGLEDNGTSDTR